MPHRLDSFKTSITKLIFVHLYLPIFVSLLISARRDDMLNVRRSTNTTEIKISNLYKKS